jgi:glycosyltransferase involved in cell wall biosynthesis
MKSARRSSARPIPPSVATQATLPRPLVSVVTPFYNTARYLTQCIESVLTQSYDAFEYILMDNCSTDGSSEIAEAYAFRDPRIRLIRCSQFLSQLQNYNRALLEISDASKYCKIVQADDYIFPECLRLMVQAFENSESIGLVSSYWLEDDQLCGSGFPRQSTILSGKECARWYFRTGILIFGSQTQVMYRSSLVRCDMDFYNVSFPFADLQKAMEILERWDFAFVHQVLSFTRRENESIVRSLAPFGPVWQLLYYIIAKHYAPIFLDIEDARSVITRYKRQYYRDLARIGFRLKGLAFWRYHIFGVKALNERETHDWPYFAFQTFIVLLEITSNPGRTIFRVMRYYRRKARRQKSI